MIWEGYSLLFTAITEIHAEETAGESYFFSNKVFINTKKVISHTKNIINLPISLNNLTY